MNAAAAVVAPVPPFGMATAVPFQVPLVIVPRVVILVLPAIGLAAKFVNAAAAVVAPVPPFAIGKVLSHVGAAAPLETNTCPVVPAAEKPVVPAAD